MYVYFLRIFWLMLGLWAIAASQLKVYGQNKKVFEWYDRARRLPKTMYYILPQKAIVADGPYISYFQNGHLQARGQYQKGLATGIWTFWYENGQPKMEGNFIGKKKTGYWKFYYENGNISREGNYKSNKPNGYWKYNYENGKTKSEGLQNSDTLEGQWKYFYQNGEAKANAFYKNGRGLYREYFEAGGLKMQGIITQNKSDSVWQYYYENGNLRAKGIEKNGLKQGKWQFFHPNGTVSSQGNFDQGQFEGTWIYYYSTGKINSEGSHKKGSKEGSWKLYYEDGPLLGEGNFRQGSGSYSEYYQNGKLKMQGQLNAGNYQGLWTYYYDEGTQEGKCLYKNGLGQYESYYRNGKIKMRGLLKNGQKTGVWQLYDESGQLSGYYKTYNEEGHNKANEYLALPDTIKAITPKLLNRPNIILDKKRVRYFRPKINEATHFILSANPLALISRSLPIALEYFIEPRLGFQIMMIAYRRPMFGSHTNLFPNEVYASGYAICITQKLYHEDRGFGYYWIGPELRFTDLEYKIDKNDGFSSIKHIAKDTKTELCLLFGTRLIKEQSRKTAYTFEVFAGLGLGYRLSVLPDKTLFGQNIPNRSYTIPVRLGCMIGYMF